MGDMKIFNCQRALPASRTSSNGGYGDFQLPMGAARPPAPLEWKELGRNWFRQCLFFLVAVLGFDPQKILFHS